MAEVSTSILGVDKEEIIQTIYNLEISKTDYFHIDVMDGEFVENNTNSKMLEFCEYINSVSNVPLDVHLMVKDIKNYIDSYSIFYPNLITFHYEACQKDDEVYEVINYIKEKGKRVGISVKPNTSVEKIIKFLPFIHVVLIMTVEPGKGAQKLIENTLEKISYLKKYIEEKKLEVEIEADGGINLENVEKIKQLGCDIIVSGTAIIKSKDYAQTINRMKQ